ncbi:MAG: hypothetical protein J6P72_10385 [Firmicutes bacterium]|nr:hypothetical protein [Bacillota bacterium]
MLSGSKPQQTFPGNAADGQRLIKSAVYGESAADRKSIAILLVLVGLLSMVNSSAFAFPSADLGSSINVELSRLVYGLGLIIAGLINDKNRKYGAVLALVGLMLPFVIYALRSQQVPALIFWLLSYFSFGFYAVYRTIVFTDLASQGQAWHLAGFGLMAGRIGDALGEGVLIAFADTPVVLIILTAILFAAAVILFLKLYPEFYLPKEKMPMSEEDYFLQFSRQYDLSPRERELLRLLLKELTNGEIAGELSISENTVKFHVRNILQKTGCKNRKELSALYAAYP